MLVVPGITNWKFLLFFNLEKKNPYGFGDIGHAESERGEQLLVQAAALSVVLKI